MTTLYSRLATRLRSLAIILPYLYIYTIILVHICNRIHSITIYIGTQPEAGVRALTADLWSINNKTRDIDQIAGTRVYITNLPAYTSIRFSQVFNTPPASSTLSISHHLHNTIPLVPNHTRYPTQPFTFPLGLLPLHATVS